MKSKTKINKAKARKRTRPASKKVAVATGRRFGSHVLRLVEHKHTGKILHHRHTSHPALALILVFVGFFLFVSDYGVKAEILPSSGSVNIGLIVPGPPPTTGATILSPRDGLKLNAPKVIDVSGTCALETLVVVSNNNVAAGSTMCTIGGTFSVPVQLYTGDNILTALNYDNLNQPGPVTPSVTVTVKAKSNNPGGTVTPNTPDSPIVTPTKPSNPSIIPGIDENISDCGQYKVSKLPAGGEPHVTLVCMPRLFFPQMKQTLGILVWGGTPPYAISVDWGDGSGDTLISMAEPGYKTITFNYAVSNTYRITTNLTDAKGSTSVFHASIQVNGVPSGNGGGSTNNGTNKDVVSEWFKTPVPLYATAVAITLGFWGGDIFDRYFGAGKKLAKLKKRKV